MPSERPIDYIDYIAVMVMIVGGIVGMASIFSNDQPWRGIRWGVLGIVGYIVIEAIGALIYG